MYAAFVLFCFVLFFSLLFQICDVAEMVIKRCLFITTSATSQSSLKLLQCHGRNGPPLKIGTKSLFVYM
jgi:hypothetical protein